MRNYISRRLNDEVVNIPILQQEVVVFVLMTNLKEGTLFHSCLGRQKLTSLSEVLLEKANNFKRGI